MKANCNTSLAHSKCSSNSLGCPSLDDRQTRFSD